MKENKPPIDDRHTRPLENAVNDAPLPHEGFRLVQAFVRITTPGVREAVIRLVEDLARIDETGRNGTR